MIDSHDCRADAGTAARRAQRSAREGEGLPDLGFHTRSIHAGYRPDSLTGAINVPIYASTTFQQDGLAQLRGGFEYSRCGNPTVAALEEVVASLEGGSCARAFSSGMAATDTVLRAVLSPGDHLVMGSDAYGGTFRLIDTAFREWGVEYTIVDTSDVAAVRGALRENTAVVWVESPTNPLLGVSDISAIAEVTRSHGAKLVVDNTFASPYLQRPLELGADVVVHSSTKYLGGHSDVVGGLVVTNDEEIDNEVLFLQGGVGAVPGSFDAYLTYRGIKTLGIRMERHCSNAQAVAEFLDGRPETAEVLYPGLPQHPGHEVAARQMRLFGGVVSVRFHSEEAARQFCVRTRLVSLAESLGGVESLVEHPASMTHQSAAGSQLEIPGDLVRISIGIEDVEDLVADFAEAVEGLPTS